MRNGNEGFVPIEYVQLADTSPNDPDWWFDCSRSQAEALLMRYEVATGSFLVRGSLCQNRYPTKWMAPEAALYNKRSIKSDVWSFGVLMYEIASSGIIPYTPIVNLHKVFREIEEGYRLPKPTTHWPPEQLDRYYDIIQQCWKQDPSDRPSFVHVQEQLDD